MAFGFEGPELQPSERLWPLSNEGVANRFFEDIEGLEQALVERCVASSARAPQPFRVRRGWTERRRCGLKANSPWRGGKPTALSWIFRLSAIR
jgi:hypothetical protein